MPLLSFSTRHVRTEAHSENTCYDKVGDWNYAEVAKSFSKQPEARERSGEIRGRFLWERSPADSLISGF